MSDDMKQCPFCAEYVKRDAVVCRFCGSKLNNPTEHRHHFHGNGSETHWVRPLNGRVLGGVCAGIAEELSAPQLALLFRLFFLFAVLFWGSGIALYLILWLLMPSGKTVYPPAGQAVPSPSCSPAPQPARHSPLVSLLIAILVLICGIALLNIFAHLWGHDLLYFPGFRLPSFALFHFHPFGGHWISPHFPSFGAVMAISFLLILLLMLFKFFRAALGCFGVLLGLIILVILVPVLIPAIVVPFALLIPILIWAIPILLILWVLKKLID